MRGRLTLQHRAASSQWCVRRETARNLLTSTAVHGRSSPRARSPRPAAADIQGPCVNKPLLSHNVVSDVQVKKENDKRKSLPNNRMKCLQHPDIKASVHVPLPLPAASGMIKWQLLSLDFTNEIRCMEMSQTARRRAKSAHN